MTELYKMIGAVFLPTGITLEEVERLREENEYLKQIVNKEGTSSYDSTGFNR